MAAFCRPPHLATGLITCSTAFLKTVRPRGFVHEADEALTAQLADVRPPTAAHIVAAGLVTEADMAEQIDHVVRALGLGAGAEGDVLLTMLKSRQVGRGRESRAIFGRSK